MAEDVDPGLKLYESQLDYAENYAMTENAKRERTVVGRHEMIVDCSCESRMEGRGTSL
jgi:hypothetical protein